MGWRGWQREEHGLLAENRRAGSGEASKAAHQRAVEEDLVGVVEERRAQEGETLAARGGVRDGNADTVPGIAGVTGMTKSSPAGNPARDSAAVGIGEAFRGQVNCLPVRVVEVRLGPQRLACLRIDGRVANRELPRTVERDSRVAKADFYRLPRQGRSWAGLCRTVCSLRLDEPDESERKRREGSKCSRMRCWAGHGSKHI
jgi:hypothetical protein